MTATMTLTAPATPAPAPTLPNPQVTPHLFGPAISRDGEHVWHIGITHAGERYTVRVAYDPRPGADPGTTDVCISPRAPLDVGTAVLRAAYHAAVDAADTSGWRWSRLYGGLASKLAWYQDIRDAGIREWESV